MDEQFWPMNFAEFDLERGGGIEAKDIVSYAYPPGRRERYNDSGWAKAKALGIAILDARDFGARADSATADQTSAVK